MLAEALEHLVRGIVDNPDDVTVKDKQLRRGSVLEVRVHPDDLGKVIGRGGRTASAFRTHPPLPDVEVCVGRVGRPHGVRGDVAVELRTDEPERRFVVGARLSVAGAAPGAPARVAVAGVRRHQGRLLVRFDELGDRTAAEVLRGATLHALVAADDAPADPEEFYDHQLVGLAVEDTAGREVGVVSEVRHGAQDLLVLDTRRSGGAAEVLVPFVEALVPEVDVAGKRLVVADRPGLLDPSEADGAPGGEETA
ncbi:hypothetical protein LUZ63_020641 [Rhynchospora breviuscula]|uniref:Ribosome maturation factor RimM n=1 Tax=Rhynchospora breviuscula TaxID=2022672 RepID=A0A9P9Z9G6_9POAL|nr:hypothetical protein LUZ63_020641 [Rhynchospora breviuscula]